MALLLHLLSWLNNIWLWFFDRFVLYPLMRYVAPKLGVRFMNFGYWPSAHRVEDKKLRDFMRNKDLEEYEPHRAHVYLYEKALSMHPEYPYFEDLEVLEVSCGQGHSLEIIERWHGPTLRLIGCDKIVPNTGRNVVYGDASHLPFGDESFDFVLNVEASHLYFDYQTFFREVSRVLRPGGVFCWLDVRYPFEGLPVQVAAQSAGLEMKHWEICNEEVIEGLNHTTKRYDDLLEKAPFFVKMFKNSLRATYCAPGTFTYERVRIKQRIYIAAMWNKK